MCFYRIEGDDCFGDSPLTANWLTAVVSETVQGKSGEWVFVHWHSHRYCCS